MYNLLSIGLGLLAWGLGAAAIGKRGKPSLVFGSMSACLLSLTIQFFEIYGHVCSRDGSWFLDVMPTLTKVAAFLAATTVMLNLIAVLRSRPSQG